MEKKLEDLTAKLEETISKVELSHKAIAETSSNMWAEIKDLKARQDLLYEREEKANLHIEELINSIRLEIQPVVDTYRAFAKGREIVVGLGSVILALGAIGAGVTYVIKKSIGL